MPGASSESRPPDKIIRPRPQPVESSAFRGRRRVDLTWPALGLCVAVLNASTEYHRVMNWSDFKPTFLARTGDGGDAARGVSLTRRSCCTRSSLGWRETLRRVFAERIQLSGHPGS